MAEADLLRSIDRRKLPRHIAVIMDGNGRWANRRGLPRIFGHRAGIRSVREIVRACGELEIGVLTLYAFSSENWLRPSEEVDALMRLLERYLKKETPELQKNNVSLRAIGRVEELPSFARQALKKAMEATSQNTGLVLNLALNYGSRQEIVDAVNRALRDHVKVMDERTLSRYVDTAGLPDPDLLIRTSGEYRISNFLLWQMAYTEIHITKTLWPDFHLRNLYEAILEYQKRERRFGGL